MDLRAIAAAPDGHDAAHDGKAIKQVGLLRPLA
jgi:hypothetical protein